MRMSFAAVAFPLLANCADAQKPETSSNILETLRKNSMQGECDNWCGAHEVPDDVSWRSTFAKEGEKGEPLVISGTVFLPDGKTPAPDVLIYAYHTDREGIYGKTGEPKHGRFRGWLLTDSNGKYEIRTIKPASYPNSTIASHVHMTLTGVNFKEDWIDSILFEGDRFISARERETAGGKGGFNPIVKPELKSDGILYCERNIQLKKT